MDWGKIGRGLMGAGLAGLGAFTGGSTWAALPGVFGAATGGMKGGGSSPSGGGGGGFDLGGFGGMYGLGMGLGSLGSFMQARAANQVKMQPLPPPNPLFPGLNSSFVSGMNTLGPQSFNTLGQMAQTGMPVDYSGMFDAFVNAGGRSVDQGRANLKEKYGAQGMRFGSTMANAAVDYENQYSRDKMNTLMQMMFQSNEAARGRQMMASQFGGGMFGQAGQAFTPSAMPIIGGQSPVGNALSSGGNMFQTFAMLRQMGII